MPDWGEEIAKRLRDAQLAPAEEADISEELRQHLDDRYAELRGHGHADAEARRITLDELGDDELRQQLSLVRNRRQREDVSWGASGRAEAHEGVRAFWHDLRIGARLLRRAPGFTVVAAVTLALGIGANTTIFSIVNALLLRPIPGIARPDELVLIGRTQGGQGFDTFSYPDYLDYRANAKRVSGIAAHFEAPAHLSTGGASERVRAGVVSGNYFHVLGVKASAGRLFLPEEESAPNAHPVLVLSYAMWHNRFGGDSAILGKSVSIDARSYTVIGVAAEGFAGLDRRSILDLYIPIPMVGALRPG